MASVLISSVLLFILKSALISPFLPFPPSLPPSLPPQAEEASTLDDLKRLIDDEKCKFKAWKVKKEEGGREGWREIKWKRGHAIQI